MNLMVIILSNKSVVEGDKVKLVKFPNNLDGFYVVTSKTDARAIGFFGIKNHEVVGLYIEEEYRDMGYGTEVIKLINENFKDLYLITSLSNLAMQHILEKLGYSKYLKYEVK